MRIRDLEWLATLADVGHLTDAAAVLGTTQPTLSRALARVEDELGVRLFERLPTGAVANPDGELVVAAARELSERYAALRDELGRRLDPDGGIVRLAFLDSMATSLVPRLLRDHHARYPRARLVLRQEPAHEIRADLDAGRAELAVTWPRPDGPFAWVPLQEERLALVVPPTHRWAGRRRLSLRELADEPQVATPSGFGFRALVEDLLAGAGISLTVAFESADLATIEGLVAAGLGVAVLPEQLAGVSGTVGIALTTPAARRTVGLAWRSDRTLSPAAARFRDHVLGEVSRGAG